MIIHVQFGSNNLVVSKVSLWDFTSEKESVMHAYSSWPLLFFLQTLPYC